MKKIHFIKISGLIFAVLCFTFALQLESIGSESQSGTYGPVLDEGFSLYYLPDDADGPLMIHLKQNEPPLLKAHSISPESPGPEDEIGILAEIYNDPVTTESETFMATVYYSTDEKETWDKIEMENDSGNNRTWSAIIPAAGEPCTLYYFFEAMDNAENYFMEIPAVDIDWASGKDNGYINSISDDNSIYTLVKDDLDILSTSIGFDGELIYVSMVVEGEISGGTVTPFEVNMYSAGFYIPSGHMEIGPKPKYVLVHAQHAQFLSFPIVGLLDIEKKLARIDSADPRYYSHRNRLYMRIDKSVLDRYEYEYIRMAMGSAIGVNAMPLTVEPKDVTSFVNVVFGEHSIEIE